MYNREGGYYANTLEDLEEQQAFVAAINSASKARNASAPPAPANDQGKPRKKLSTQPGEARAKLVAALTKHHRYADGGALHLEPVGNNELARLAGVHPSTASDFFKEKFEGHGKYKKLCQDAAELAFALKILNGEVAPHHLFGNSEQVAADEK